jgi:hypothetical protein
MILVLTEPLPERKASPVVECSAGSNEPLHGEGNVLGGERAAVGKRNAVAQLEGDLLAVFRYGPRFRQFGFEVLRMAVGAHQHSAGQVADRKGRIVIDQSRVESLGLGAQAEAQLAAVLREGGWSQGKRASAKHRNSRKMRGGRAFSFSCGHLLVR